MGIEDILQSQSQILSIIDNMHNGIYMVDLSRRISYWNKAAEKITGYSAKEVIGHSCADNILEHVDQCGNSLCLGSCPLSKAMCDVKNIDSKVYLHHKNGHRIPVSVTVTPLKNSDNEVVGGIEVFTDLTSHEANILRILELEKLAMNDKLTSLANRNYIENELEQRIKDFFGFKVPFGLLFIDIDHFKGINDKYGHLVGDKVLKFVAETMIINSRPFDVVGRWGGEEFVVIIRNVSDETMQKVGQRLLGLIENSFLMHEGEKIYTTISIGATLSQKDDTIESLIERADRLLYHSKYNGRNQITCG